VSGLRSEIEGVLLAAGYRVLANDTEDLIGELEAAFEEALDTALDRWKESIEGCKCDDDCPGMVWVDLTYNKLQSLLA
jgi:hypothetical protein